MAETAVNLAIETLGSLLVQEIKLLNSAKQQLKDIKRELESIRSFLRDADATAAATEKDGGESSEGFKTWVKQVREVAYRIEDVLIAYKFQKRTQESGRFGRLRNICCFLRDLKVQHDFVKEIEDIKSSLADIQQTRQNLSFRSVEGESSSGTRNFASHDTRVGPFFMEDDEVVGIETTRDSLGDMLTKGKQKLSVIVVVGEGGLGKTTIAGRIYSKQDVKACFNLQALINVRKESEKKDLLRRIIKKFCIPTEGDINEKEEDELINTLRENLKDKRFLVVFDDVRKIDFWEDIKQAFLNNDKGSRIMLTARDKRVAEFVPPSILHLHELKPLPSAIAWNLFCRNAFGPDKCCPLHLKTFSEKIVEKCGGLPIAIVAVARLLSTKNEDASEWQRLLDGLGSKLGSDPHLKDCNRVLTEGYLDLPKHLQHCLLYFALFPESYSVTCGRLMRLWMAEGFLQYSESIPPEEVAKDYLAELINRNLVQVVTRDISGRASSCRVHDLMYEVIRRKTEELGFCRLLKKKDGKHYGCSKTRRISIHTSTDGVVESIKDSTIHSVLLFQLDKLPDSFMNSFAADFKFIKVLDFRNSSLSFLPEEVGNLINLQYLNLRSTKVEVLPKSIGKLHDLETLDLKLSLVTILPAEIKNLKKLRYLSVNNLPIIGDSYKRGTKIQEGFGSLTDLQKLYFVLANSEVLEELRNLGQLKKLGIMLTTGGGKNLRASLEKLECLESLTVASTNREEILDIESMASPPQHLRRLYLMGNMKKLPDWILKLQSLIKIDLDLSGLTDNPVSVLQSLPKLLVLRLKETHHDEKMHLKDGWFPKLQELTLLDLKGLKMMVIEDGAMPNLRHLEICQCPLSNSKPTGIEHLRNLKNFRFIAILPSTARVPEIMSVIRFHISGRKSATKAMKIAASVDGVESLAFQQPNGLVVIGKGFDVVGLTALLRKKVGYVELVSVGPSSS